MSIKNGNSKFTFVKDCGCIECYIHNMARKEKRNCAKFRDANNLPDCRDNFTYRKTWEYSHKGVEMKYCSDCKIMKRCHRACISAETLEDFGESPACSEIVLITPKGSGLMGDIREEHREGSNENISSM